MALFLFGAAAATSVVMLSESERVYYRSSRYTMEYLGVRNGRDIFYDRVTGLYYTDDGWDVNRVGIAGRRPHPLDMQRIRGLLSEYSPSQTPFAGYIMATYAGNPNQVWSDFYARYQRPKEPKKPTFGRSIRKARWAKYDEEYAEWEAKTQETDAAFRQECERWEREKAEYDARNPVQPGKDVLLMAYGNPRQNKAYVAQPRVFKLKVPDGTEPGQTIEVQCGNETIPVKIPDGVVVGQEIEFQLPPQQTSSRNVVVQQQRQPSSQRNGATTRQQSSNNYTSVPTEEPMQMAKMAPAPASSMPAPPTTTPSGRNIALSLATSDEMSARASSKPPPARAPPTRDNSQKKPVSKAPPSQQAAQSNLQSRTSSSGESPPPRAIRPQASSFNMEP